MAGSEVATGGNRGERVCPWCGAPNPPGRERCASCGSWLASEVPPAGEERGTVIDVSGEEPRVVEQEPKAPPGGFSGVWYDTGRGMVLRTGGRGCLLWAVVATLLVCAQCVIAWYVLKWIF